MNKRVLYWTATVVICCLVLWVALAREARMRYAGRWQAAMDDPDPQVRVEAARVLAEELIWEEKFRMNAAWRLWQARGSVARAAVPGLLRALKDPDPGMKFAAVTALTGMGPDAKEAIPTILAELRRPGGLGECGVYLLGCLGPDAVPALVDVLKWDDMELVRSAARALRQIDPEAAKAAGVVNSNEHP